MLVLSISRNLLHNFHLQASHKQIQHQCNMFRQEAQTAQKHVQDYVQQKHKKEAELYVKVRTACQILLTLWNMLQLTLFYAAVCCCSQ